MKRTTILETVCIFDDGKSQYECYNELDLLNYIQRIKEELINNDMKNMIFCLEKIGYKKVKDKNFKFYMLVNEQYSTKKDVLNNVRKYKKKGFRAFIII